jgi:inhibitor of KinA sporulation pathway (predicted exonuclease)
VTDPLPAARLYLVVDLEATTSDDRSLPQGEMETIEIGAVLVDATTLAPLAEHQSFVRPVRHPKLLPFCTTLTSITQSDVDGAPEFPHAMDALGRALVAGRDGVVFTSWGRFDKTQLERDCAYHAIPYRMPEHLNLKERFSHAQGLRRMLGMAEALSLCGLPLAGTHHRGIDDARNIARMLPWIVGDRKIPPRGSRR